MSKFSRIVSVTVLLLLIVAGQETWADSIPVKFSIEGTFSADSNAKAVVSKTDPSIVRVGKKDAWIRFTPVSGQFFDVNAPLNGVALGEFSWGDGCDLIDRDSFDGVKFNLKISQTDPTNGANSVVANLTGCITTIAWVFSDNDVVMTFGDPINIPKKPTPGDPTVTYKPHNVSFQNWTPCDPKTLLRMDIDYKPAVVPLPSVAWSAGMLLITLAGAGLLRRQLCRDGR